jgi:hypothetical protein
MKRRPPSPLVHGHAQTPQQTSSMLITRTSYMPETSAVITMGIHAHRTDASAYVREGSSLKFANVFNSRITCVMP